jgi:CheY-like chemotaxis protein
MRKVLEITFASQDFRLILCSSADEAVSKLAERPAIALVDAGLEGTSGYDLCRNLKASQPGLSVIILSNKQQPYDRNRGAQVGADDFMDKPFDTQQLIDKVTALSKKQPSAPLQAAPMAASPARAPTLSYGQNPVPGGIGAPPVPVPSPPAPVARAQTAPGMGTAAAAAASRAPTQVSERTPKPAPAAPAPAAAAPIAAAMSGNGADFAQKLGALGLTSQQVEGVLSLSREVVERVVWEVVPTLAETLIREEIQRLTKE